MEAVFEYYAFISYKREDEKWAKWLQGKLEGYRLPAVIRKEIPRLPKRIRPIFRDKTDLGAVMLTTGLINELDKSRYLIVICSPRSAQSEWVGKEITEFVKTGRAERIILFIVDGEPNSNNERECFHPVIKKEIPDMLGININEIGKQQAFVKVAAKLLDLSFDTLWNRFLREQRKKRIIAAVAGLLLLAGAGFIWDYYTTVEKGLIELDDQLDVLLMQMINNEKKLDIANLRNDNLRLSLQWQEREIEYGTLIRDIIGECILSPDDEQYLMWGKIDRIAKNMVRVSTFRREAENISKRNKEAAQMDGGDVSDWREVKYTLTTDEILRELTTRLDQYMHYFPETKNYIPAVKQFYTDIKDGKQKLGGMVVMGTKDDLPHPLFKIGDIVLTRKGKTVNNVDDYIKANETQGDDVHTFLRLDTDGQLSHHEAIRPPTDVLTEFLYLIKED